MNIPQCKDVAKVNCQPFAINIPQFTDVAKVNCQPFQNAVSMFYCHFSIFCRLNLD
jgi:hypothetical protein